MKSFKSFYHDIFHVKPSDFERHALEVFKYQAANNRVYKSYIDHLGVNPVNIKQLAHIPFLPISFFKTQSVCTGYWEPTSIFESSGTTGQVRSRHLVKDVPFYLNNAERIFNIFYGDIREYHIFALLPSYLERENSSIVLMAEHFIKLSMSPYSGFYLNNYSQLLRTISDIQDGRKILLLGVSFALLELAEKHAPDLSGVIVMETGGMKGRRREMVRPELHKTLREGLNVQEIHSEYGMTELLSQAYSYGEGVFEAPPWMRVLLRDINDPFDLSPKRSSGGMNIIDLANIDSCAFIETQDVGKINEDNTFEVLGRFDNSDIRGCNLLVS